MVGPDIPAASPGAAAGLPDPGVPATPPPPVDAIVQDPAELLALARRHDPDRTLCVLLAPPAVRTELLALLLLNHELARVAETVRQPLAGLVRYRFWRDRLADAAAGRPVDLPLVQALARPLREGRLDLAELESLITARATELDGLLAPGAAPAVPPPTIHQLEAWLRATSGRLAGAMAGLLGSPSELRAAAEAAGTAFGLVGIVRATLVEAYREHRLVGRSLVDIAGLGPEALRSPNLAPALRALVEELLQRAERAAAEARRLPARPARPWLAPLLLATLAEERARGLRRAGLDPRRIAGRPGSPLLPVRLVVAWLLRRP